MGIIGTGNQGRTQLAGVCEARNIKRVKAFDRVEDSARLFCEEMSTELDVEITPVDSAEEAVKDSDIVITMTTSRTPVLLGDWLEASTSTPPEATTGFVRRSTTTWSVVPTALSSTA